MVIDSSNLNEDFTGKNIGDLFFYSSIDNCQIFGCQIVRELVFDESEEEGWIQSFSPNNRSDILSIISYNMSQPELITLTNEINTAGDWTSSP